MCLPQQLSCEALLVWRLKSVKTDSTVRLHRAGTPAKDISIAFYFSSFLLHVSLLFQFCYNHLLCVSKLWFFSMCVWQYIYIYIYICMSGFCCVCHVFPPHVSIFGLFPVLVSCHYELSMFQLCLSRYVLIIPCILVLSFQFDFVWSTRYFPVYPVYESCLVLPWCY